MSATPSTQVTVDGLTLAGTAVTLVDDGQTHTIEILFRRVTPAVSGTPA